MSLITDPPGITVPWELKLKKPLIGDETSPVTYLNDITKSDNVDRTQLSDIVQKNTEMNLHQLMMAKASTPTLVEQSIMWPVSSLKPICVAPVVVAALFAFYLIPAWVPATSTAAALSGGYAAGAVTYYVRNIK